MRIVSTMKRTSLLSLLLIAIVVGACAPQPRPVDNTQITTTGTYTPKSAFDPIQNVNAKAFEDEEELKAFLSNSGNRDFASGGGAVGRAGVAEAAMDAVAPSAAPTMAKGAAQGFSTTNNQVAGVDEADIIKTDGEYIYTITGTTLFIVKAYPGADAEVVATLDLKAQPTGLFIQDNRLAVFGNYYDLDYFKEIDYVPRNGMSFLNVYDISDKAKPTLVKEYKFEGYYFDARMHEGRVYFLAQSTPSVQYPLPIIMDGTTKRTMAASDIAYYPIPYDNVQYITVHSLALASPDLTSSKSIAVQWDNKLYASENNLYLTYTQNINQWEISQEIMMKLLEPKLTQADRTLIEKIKSTDDEVLSQGEKRGKIQQVYSTYFSYLPSKEQQSLQEQIDKETKERMEEYEALQYTIITRISMNDGQLAVDATGKVPGQVLNQFSMDEYNNVFRIATTIQQPWWGIRPMEGVARATEAVAPDAPVAKSAIMPPRQSGSSNNVYTLDMSLNILGRLEELAEGESIYSARFIGDRLYLVTFRQMDPFFVIDLSNPSKPQNLGELKIPGFSRYLHPYDENHIIGIGREATETGRQQGLKISIFNVADVAKPVEVAKWVGEDEYAQSSAEWEHKAFLFDKEKELLVIPAYSYNYDYRSGASSPQYNGAMVFKINTDEIVVRGIVDHTMGQQQYWGPLVERSLWIEDLLYTKSPNLLRINTIDDLAKVKNVDLVSSASGPYKVY
jgi:inhibitor of cysteine peptidase